MNLNKNTLSTLHTYKSCHWEYSKNRSHGVTRKEKVMSLREIRSINLDALSLGELRWLAQQEDAHYARHNKRGLEILWV